MKTYKCATGLMVMSDIDYVEGDYVEGCGTIVAIEDCDEIIFDKRDELISRARGGDKNAQKTLVENWSDF